MKSSPLLLAFYKAWRRGADENGYVRRDNAGLCYNLRVYILAAEKYPDYAGDKWACADLLHEMKKQYRSAGLDDTLPFDGHFWRYNLDSNQNACSSNPKRIQWVLDRIADMEE